MPLLSAATIHDIVHVRSSLYRAAMREHPPVVIANPFADLDLPRIEPRPVEFYEHDEAAALYGAAGDWRTLVELGMDVGLRCGEIYGLHGHRVDWLRGKITVVGNRSSDRVQGTLYKIWPSDHAGVVGELVVVRGEGTN